MKNPNTQEIFKRFLKKVPNSYGIQGFCSDGVLVLTDDCKLYRTLLKQEKTRIRAISAEKRAKNEAFFPQFGILNTFGLELNEYANLPSRFGYNNSLYARQQLIEDYDITLGGDTVFVATKDPNRLKDYVRPIIERHLEEFGIDLDCGCVEYYNQAPALIINGTVDDEKLFKSDFEEIFDTRLALKIGLTGIAHQIDSLACNHAKTNSDGKGK